MSLAQPIYGDSDSCSFFVTQQMRILLLRDVVSMLSTRADIVKSERKTMSQSLGSYNAGALRRIHVRGPLAVAHLDGHGQGKPRSSLLRRMIAVAGGARRLGVRVMPFFHCAYGASQGAIERMWPHRCIHGYKQTCVRSVDLWCSEMQ